MIASLLAAAALATAVPDGRREVVVLYHDTTFPDEPPRGENLFTAVEASLNHLGLVVRFHDLGRGLPDEALTARARGVVSLDPGPSSPDPAALAGWLRARRAAGQAVVLANGPGFLMESAAGRPAAEAGYAGLLREMGLGAAEATEGERAWAPGGWAPLEAAYPRRPDADMPGVRRLDPAHAALLSATGPGGAEDLVVAGPGVGYVAAQTLLVEQNPITFRVRWRLDPYRFFAQALGTAGLPAFDPSTVNGKRAFFAHIDGDGFTNMSVEPKSRMAAEVVRDELLARTWLPTTVSVIAGEIAGRRDREDLARSLYRLPNVEAGVHSWTHPHDWLRNTLTPQGGVGDDAEGDDGKRVVFQPRREVDDAVAYVQRLQPPGKKVMIELWSGRTNPPAAFLARTNAIGVANLNGGDALLQPGAPSLAAVAPLARRVGPWIQPYAAAANENLFTNLWTGPFDGQRRAIDLYRFTEGKRRLCAVNLYYHFYAAERAAGLKALRALYAWSEKQPLAHLTTAQYARSVEGFFTGRLTPDGPAAWDVADAGACRTLRFDGEARTPDLAASTAVAGWARSGDRLWVHLAAPDARIVLAERPADRPRLADATAVLAAWKAEGRTIAATFDAAAPCRATLAGLPAGAALRYKGDFAGPRTVGSDGLVSLTAGRGRRFVEVSW